MRHWSRRSGLSALTGHLVYLVYLVHFVEKTVGISISVFPIVRMSVQMHYCQDENLVLLNTVDNAIWKTVYKTAPDAFFYDWPGS